ncbi:hypothetical protein K449DRAFT_389413 [Hypoxylon sp. EC38]|nr:hypothetical protein K449DRAFT_389413 [Hypoxylon sp. EC38]
MSQVCIQRIKAICSNSTSRCINIASLTADWRLEIKRRDDSLCKAHLDMFNCIYEKRSIREKSSGKNVAARLAENTAKS